ncbi:MAG: rhomboid family intramembrane serine protease [Bacillota bacterium]
MIPLRDSVRSGRRPYVNISLVLINIFVFIQQLAIEPYQLNQIYYTYGVIPAEALNVFFAGGPSLPLAISFITATFIHGGWFHLIGNMLFLWIFGDNIEDRLGRARYLLFYLTVGVAGGVAHVLTNPASTIPVIGASGAVAGVLGAYLITFPRSRILALVPVLFFITVVEVPAVIFIAVWFAIQIFNGVAFLGGTANAVAWWAHIGGFLAGLALIKLMARRGAVFARP